VLGFLPLSRTYSSLSDLGLDSLMAELSSLIRTELQVDLPIRAFIEDPSIANLAALLIDQLIPGVPKQCVVNVVDLNAEAVLDPAICPGTAYLEQVAEPASILLTGATGFWEPFTHELLQTKADIYCLVRSPNTEAGKIRLQRIWNPITLE